MELLNLADFIYDPVQLCKSCGQLAFILFTKHLLHLNLLEDFEQWKYSNELLYRGDCWLEFEWGRLEMAQEGCLNRLVSL